MRCALAFRRWGLRGLLVLAMSLSGCATRPSDPAEALAAAQGMTRLVVTGRGFRHLAYARGGVGVGEGWDGRVHLYLEGDGRPWASRHRVASDPTPLNPFALRLMGRDTASVLYVGRPCYHGFVEDPGCGPWLWTQGRYSPAVVASMVAAIETLVPTREGVRITLIGYSGGGVLALLIASRLDAVDQVITVAANLNVEAWADHHAYSPLAGSLNPAALAPLPPRVHQLHLAGARDRQVPPVTISSFLARNPGASFRIIEGFDHRCCWIEQWPELLVP